MACESESVVVRTAQRQATDSSCGGWPHESLDLVKFSIVTVSVENPGELHDLGFLVDRIDDPVLALCHPKAGETSIGKMGELFGIRRTGRAAKTQNFEKNLTKAFRVTSAKVLERVEDGV